MKAPLVRLYVRVRLADGTRPFLEPAVAANGKVKPGIALRDGQPEHFENGVHHLRYLKAGKRVWEPVGKDAQAAMDALKKRQRGLDAVAAGVLLADPPTASMSTRRALFSCNVAYLAKIEDHWEAKTYAAY